MDGKQALLTMPPRVPSRYRMLSVLGALAALYTHVIAVRQQAFQLGGTTASTSVLSCGYHGIAATQALMMSRAVRLRMAERALAEWQQCTQWWQ